MNRRIGVILSYVLMVFEVLSTLLLTPFIIRTLGQAEYGVYKLIVVISGYLLLLDLGISNTVTRFIPKYRVAKDIESEKKFLGITSVFYGIVAFISLVVGVVLIIIFPYFYANGLNSDEIVLGQKLLFITVLNVVITLASAPFTNVLLAYEKFGVSKFSSIIQIILRIGLTILCLKLGMKSIGLCLVTLFTTLLVKLFFIFYAFFVLKIKMTLKGVDKSFLKGIVGYSFLILVQMIATQINMGVDQILIGSMVVNSAILLAVYGLGAQVVNYFQSIGVAFTNVLMPGVVKLVETNDKKEIIENEMIRIGRFIFVVLGIIFVVFLLCGKQFIVLWAGEEYIDAYYVFIILVPAYLLIYPQAIGNQILWAKNMHKEQSFIKLTIVILNIFLTMLLIKVNPLLGAAFGTFISLLLGDVVLMNIVFVKKLHTSLSKLYFGILDGILPSLFISFVIGYRINSYIPYNWLGLFIIIASMVSVYCICLLVFGFNNYEKGILKQALSKFSRAFSRK